MCFLHTPNNDITFGWLIWYKNFASFAKILTTSSDKGWCNFFTTKTFPVNFPLNTTAKVPLPVKYKRKKARIGQENPTIFVFPTIFGESIKNSQKYCGYDKKIGTIVTHYERNNWVRLQSIWNRRSIKLFLKKIVNWVETSSIRDKT